VEANVENNNLSEYINQLIAEEKHQKSNVLSAQKEMLTTATTFMEEQEKQHPFQTVWSIVEREYLKPRGIEPADCHGGKMIGPACKAYKNIQ